MFEVQGVSQIKINPHFRELKALSIGSHFLVLYDKFYSNCRSLESLKMSFVDYKTSLVHIKTSSCSLNAILKLNKGLKSLEFYGREVFKEDFSSGIEVRLKEFKFYPSIFYRSLEQLELQNLDLFLKTQRDTIECLRIEKVSVEISRTILSMQCLKQLTIGRTTYHRSFRNGC